MFLDFFYLLKSNGLPVSLHEQLSLMEALKQGVAGKSVEDFYYLCRTVMVKEEHHLDRFDKLFGEYFKGIERIDDDLFLKHVSKDWLRQQLERMLSPKELAELEKNGGVEALMEKLKELMEEENREGRNQFNNGEGEGQPEQDGENPDEEGRKQKRKGKRKGQKVWEKRDFKNFDDQIELNTRNIKMALRRLRLLTREGKPEELDIDDTIKKTSNDGGILNLSIVPSRKNRVKVLLLMDVGGSMDDHITLASRMFSAARYEFKYMEHFYFHNCLYEYLWKDNTRRFHERIPTLELLYKYNKDYKVIFIGDAAMSPYEIMYRGGSVEHYNDEAGIQWLQRIKDKFTNMIWLNPNPEYSWEYYQSTQIIQEFTDHRMFPLTLEGLTLGMKALKNRQLQYKPKGR